MTSGRDRLIRFPVRCLWYIYLYDQVEVFEWVVCFFFSGKLYEYISWMILPYTQKYTYPKFRYIEIFFTQMNVCSSNKETTSLFSKRAHILISTRKQSKPERKRERKKKIKRMMKILLLIEGLFTMGVE